MCKNPLKLEDGRILVCRKCNQCVGNRISDVVGRAIAEQRSARETFALTLTIRGNELNSILLNYPDVRRMLAHLRYDGYNVRFICVGEYGATKGRAHWHIVLFNHSDNKRLNVPLVSNFSWKYWPHGHVFAQTTDYKGFFYILKYLQKDVGVRGVGAVHRVIHGPTYSKGLLTGRPLGADCFYEIADEMVAQGLPMHSAEYSFAAVTSRSKDGKYRPRKFVLQGRMRELFFERYVSGWLAAYGELPPETDYLYEKHFDKIARKEMRDDPWILERQLAAKNALRYSASVKRAQARAAEVREIALAFEAQQLAFLLTDAPYRGVVCFYSDGTAVYNNGSENWTVTAGSVVPLAEQLRHVPLGRLRSAVCRWIEREAGRLWPA